MATWEDFESEATNYMYWLLDQDPDSLGNDDLMNVAALAAALGEWGYSLTDIQGFHLEGGSNSQVSDILIMGTDCYIEVKMRAAQCGQMVVQFDETGGFSLASDDVTDLPPWQMPLEAGDDPEMDTDTPDSFFSLEDVYLYDARETFLEELNKEYLRALNSNAIDEDEGDEEKPTWSQYKFMEDRPESSWLVYNHYESKGAILFITRRKGQVLDDSKKGWLLFRTEDLENYFHVCGSYRYKKSGSSKLAYKNLDDAMAAMSADPVLQGQLMQVNIQDLADGTVHSYGEIADAYEGDVYSSVIDYGQKSLGLCLQLDPSFQWDERKTFTGDYYRYKLLNRGGGLYQIRQLSKLSAPTIVMKERIRDNGEINMVHPR